MIWIRDKVHPVHLALDSLRHTDSQHERRIEHEQNIYQDKINWRIIGSVVSCIIFFILFFTIVVGIPIIKMRIKKELNCSTTSTSVRRLPLNESIRLCTGNALWDSKGITVAGLSNGLPSTSLEGLNYPNDIYVYGNGTILVADVKNNRIMKWNPNATIGIIIAGTGAYGSWSTLLARPIALTVRDKLMYVSDLENYRIQVFPLDNNASEPEAVTMIGHYGQGSDMNQINQVTSIIAPHVSPSLLYMADSKNQRILVWDSETETATLVAGESNIIGSDVIHLYNPLGIVLDEKNNRLYVADTSNNRIKKYDLNTHNSSMTVAGWGQLNHPSALQLDPSGTNMFIVDTLNHRILLWLNGAREGRMIAGNGLPGNSDYQLHNPSQIRFDSAYNLYVVDTYNSRIQRFNLISNGC